jgi:two-component system sporulation sensor kinase A
MDNPLMRVNSRQEQLDRLLADWVGEMSILENERFVKVSRQLLNIFGFEEQELLGEKFDKLVCPDHFEMLYVEQYFFSHHSRNKNSRIKGLKKDQTIVYVNVFTTYIEREGSCYVIIDYIEDITDRRAELDYSREMEERFRSAFHYAAVGMSLVSINGKVQEMNYALSETLGLSDQVVEGLPFTDLIHPDDAASYLECCTQLIIGEVQCCEIERRFVHRTGQTVWGVLSITLVRDVDGRPLNYIMQLQDVTQKREAEELLRKSDKLSAVGQLAAGVAHEVRNPLTVLKGFAQMLLSGEPNNSYYPLMLSEVERIESIISEFLMLAKPQVAKFEPTDFLVLAKQVFSLMETKAIMYNVQIQTDFSLQDAIVECDENQIKQVLINMIQNAIEAMPGGGVIHFAVKQRGSDTLVISIADNGSGIPEDRIPRLGEPFYSSKEKGTGLGLMISYQIIQKHNGHITVRSKLNEGTIFAITLPYRQGSGNQDDGGKQDE